MKQKKMASRSGWAQNIAFTTTEVKLNEGLFTIYYRFFLLLKTRFHENEYETEIPAPNSYAPKVYLADQIPKENVRAGAFGGKDQVEK
jgi:hypothetical protein